MMPNDYELEDRDYADFEAFTRFRNHAYDLGLINHLAEGREAFLPVASAHRASWHNGVNPLGWNNYTYDPKHDVFVNHWGMVGEARKWIEDRGCKASAYFHAKDSEKPKCSGAGLTIFSPNGSPVWSTAAHSMDVGYVWRFGDQADAALFKTFFSDRVGA